MFRLILKNFQRGLVLIIQFGFRNSLSYRRQVRVALATKISKERVGTELEGMFNGKPPWERQS
jgi:hypothetical protein